METLHTEAELNNEFPLDASLVYLNHAAVAPWPRRTTQAVEKFARENMYFGAAHYERWLRMEQILRDQLARLIGNVRSQNIALQKNTSEGLSAIAYGLTWKAGDEIVITDQEFPSNRIVWESLCTQGVKVIEAPLPLPDPESAIIERLDPATRLLSVSSVQYGTGIKLNLTRLGEACRDRNILFCVDAIQSLGAAPFDVHRCHADFVVADGHKWMLGPEGIALLYVNPELCNQLAINEFGWHMVEQVGDYTRKDWNICTTARRFECGSPNMLGIHALSASIGLLLEIGMNEVEQRIQQRTDYLYAELRKLPGISLLTPDTPDRRAGIVTFASNRIANETLFSALKAQNIVCAPRGGGIRFSPHFYTPIEALDRAIDAVARTNA